MELRRARRLKPWKRGVLQASDKIRGGDFELQSWGFIMHSRYRTPPAGVMNEAFRRSFPPQHDLPPAMSALLAKLAALELASDPCRIVSSIDPAKKARSREAQMA